MKFDDLLLAAFRRSESPLPYDRRSEQALARPVIDMLQAWVAAHVPDEDADSEFDAGYRALAAQLLAELDGSANVPE